LWPRYAADLSKAVTTTTLNEDEANILIFGDFPILMISLFDKNTLTLECEDALPPSYWKRLYARQLVIDKYSHFNIDLDDDRTSWKPEITVVHGEHVMKILIVDDNDKVLAKVTC
jgi:hypothetical protein